uniref:Uncharacterized protein AlNc14C10G1246 n=1 Tax=Albugo laibachii Nc14 TaxID=890382 RepID=F0W2J9_9STRA|nr:conserved hypothetical protein [Albugo laibachii Nc14]|eukprot:CCA15285.1 conserved hypothetical protein [Albugo laibachii Nc14]
MTMFIRSHQFEKENADADAQVKCAEPSDKCSTSTENMELATSEFRAKDGIPDQSLTAPLNRATFLCLATADFHPPEWACEPLDVNEHARLEAYRDSRHCATYMIATKRVCYFGRDQEHCDHVLGNPSISRKHAAFIHDDAGGIYIVDLMSRHGTLVGRKEVTPHDPLLLHDGDTIKFGQSVRVYLLRGVSAEGTSAPLKKSWPRVKLKAPSVSNIIPKLPTRPKYSANVTKLINTSCYATITDEKLEEYWKCVEEFTEEERKDFADSLLDKFEARYEFHATQVHRNAFMLIVALLKRNICVDEFEANLSKITQLSQQRNDSIYRADARKLLQLMAATRLDPVASVSPNCSLSPDHDTDSADSEGEDREASIPTRERVLSDEGRKLFLAGHNSQSVEYQPPDMGLCNSQSKSADQETTSLENREEEDNCSFTTEQQPQYEIQPIAQETSGFSFMTNNGASGHDDDEPAANTTSAFRFLQETTTPNLKDATAAITPGNEAVEEVETPSPDIEIRHEQPPPLPAVLPDDLLMNTQNMADDLYEEMWHSTCELKEWSSDLPGCFDPIRLEAIFRIAHINVNSKRRVGGQEQWLLQAVQRHDGTMFLAELMLLPSLQEVCATFKWIVNSLLYENSHESFINIFSYCIQKYIYESSLKCIESNMSPVSSTGHQSSLGACLNTRNHCEQEVLSVDESAHDDERVDDESDTEDDLIELFEIRNLLVDEPNIEPSQFEQVWVNGCSIGTMSYKINLVPTKEHIIQIMKNNALCCLASGCVDGTYKFYFYSESRELKSAFCVELLLDSNTAEVHSTMKRFSVQELAVSDELSQDQVDASFMCHMEEIFIQNLDIVRV